MFASASGAEKQLKAGWINFGNRLSSTTAWRAYGLLGIVIKRVRVTLAAFSFSASFLTLDADACGSYFLYPLLDVFGSWPAGAINAEVPGVRVYFLSANNLHRGVVLSDRSVMLDIDLCVPPRKSYTSGPTMAPWLKTLDNFTNWLCSADKSLLKVSSIKHKVLPNRHTT
jgi:hypothetical protein